VFAIAIKPDRYPTYILSDKEAHSRLEVVPERGGIITSWRIQGQNILYLDVERFANPELSVRGGIPILFPICGNLPDNTYTHQGQQYALKQHGFARDLPWEVIERSTDNCASLTLSLQSNAETLAVYPFDFQLEFTYELKGNTLTIRQCYTNKSDETMPFSTGLHPYFWATDKTQLSFEIPASQYRDREQQEAYPFQNTFDFSCDEIDVALEPLSEELASLTSHRRNLKIALAYSECYSTLVFWTIKGKDYVCLEPWSSPRNALNTGDRLIFLEANSSCETWVEMSVSYLPKG